MARVLFLLKKRSLAVFAFGVAALVTVGSLGPLDCRGVLHMHSHRRIRMYGIPTITPHEMVHLMVFGTIALLLCINARSKKAEVIALSMTVMLGFVIESLQFLFSTSPFET